MNIVFDIFLSNPGLVDEIAKAPELNECFEEMFSFVQGRLKPLEDEINKEETAEPDKLKGTIIFLEQTADDPGRFVGFHGYTQPLLNKMKDSFVENDILFTIKKIRTLLDRKKN